MRYISILCLLFLQLSSCKQKSLQEDIEQIKKLEKEISSKEAAIKDLQSNKDESVKSLEVKLKNLKKSKDSIHRLHKVYTGIDVMANSNVNTNYSKKLAYETLPPDKYWTRGTYYVSENKNEYFYNVRTSIINDQARFYFIGVKQPFDEKNPVGTIYELDEDKSLHVIDTINLLPKIKGEKGWELHSNKETHLQEFMLFQLDNLIVKDGRLYYYKIKEVERSYLFSNATKEYYEYIIGTKASSKKIDNIVLSNVIVNTTTDSKILNPTKTKLAVNSGELLDFYEIPNVNTLYDSLYLNDKYYTYIESLPKIDFKLSDFIKLESDQLYTDTDSNETLLFGGVCWHSRKNILYFDNSGMLFRCIWEIDFDKNKVTKIVPEHEAIHPYFFEVRAKAYIAYVEKNKIMLCEPKSNFK